MNAAQIHDAVAALDQARRALNTGLASIEDQMRIARLCADAAATLRVEMESIGITIKGEK